TGSPDSIDVAVGDDAVNPLATELVGGNRRGVKSGQQRRAGFLQVGLEPAAQSPLDQPVQRLYPERGSGQVSVRVQPRDRGNRREESPQGSSVTRTLRGTRQRVVETPHPIHRRCSSSSARGGRSLCKISVLSLEARG